MKLAHRIFGKWLPTRVVSELPGLSDWLRKKAFGICQSIQVATYLPIYILYNPVKFKCSEKLQRSEPGCFLVEAVACSDAAAVV